MTTQAVPTAHPRAGAAGLWFIVEGVLVALLGVAAAMLPGFAGLAAALVFGWALLISGLVGIVGLFAVRGIAHPIWRGLQALLAVVAGAVVLWAPLAGVVTLTILIAAYLFMSGAASIAMAFDHRRRRHGGWVWPILSGVIGILLALYIVALHPVGGAVFIGFLVAIQLLVGGVSLIALGLAVRRGTA